MDDGLSRNLTSPCISMGLFTLRMHASCMPHGNLLQCERGLAVESLIDRRAVVAAVMQPACPLYGNREGLSTRVVARRLTIDLLLDG